MGPFGVRSEANGPENEPDLMPQRSYILSLIQMPCSLAPSRWLGVAQVGSGCQMAPGVPLYTPTTQETPSIFQAYTWNILSIFQEYSIICPLYLTSINGY